MKYEIARWLLATTMITLIALPLIFVGVVFWIWCKIPEIPRKEDFK
jgi:predicted secreted protein